MARFAVLGRSWVVGLKRWIRFEGETHGDTKAVDDLEADERVCEKWLEAREVGDDLGEVSYQV
eukprot:744890-Amorphochlora_amoeboformis.AAC.2